MKVKCKFCGADFHYPTKNVECTSCGNTDKDRFVFSEDDDPVVPQTEMMFEVKYLDIHESGPQERVEQVTQSRMERMIALSEDKYKDKYFQQLEGRKLGMGDNTWLATWYKIGLKNPWIASAWDPKFTINSFAECMTLDYLMEQLSHGNWSTGTAFYYRNLVFINQVNGGDEWKIAKEDVDFESYSCGRVISRKGGKREFAEDIYRYLNTPKEELRTFDFKIDIPAVIEFDGITYEVETND